MGASRRAALPDRAPVVRALAEARVDRGPGGDALARAAEPRGCEPASSARLRFAAVRRLVPRPPRADVSVGVPGSAARARPRVRLRLARIPGDPPRIAIVARGLPRSAP